MNYEPLWVMPAIFLLIAAQGLATSRGRVNLVFSALVGVFVGYLVILHVTNGSRPSVELVVVTAVAALFMVTTAARARVAWVAGLADQRPPVASVTQP